MRCRQSRQHLSGIDAPCVLASRRPASTYRRVITLKEALKVGVDIIEIERVRSALGRPSFRERCFTEAERTYCDSRTDPAQSYAARFAGKEAVGKALGCGVRFTWKEIEIVGRPKPGVRLSGRTAAFAERVRAGAIDLSMTH